MFLVVFTLNDNISMPTLMSCDTSYNETINISLSHRGFGLSFVCNQIYDTSDDSFSTNLIITFILRVIIYHSLE